MKGGKGPKQRHASQGWMGGLGSSGAKGRGLGNDRVDGWRATKLLITTYP